MSSLATLPSPLLFHELPHSYLTCPAEDITSIIAESGSIEKDNRNGKQEKCEFYLAESSIPNTGLGVYTAVPFEPGQEIGEPDIFVPVLDFDNSNWALILEFVWNADITYDLHFENYHRCDIFSPGLRAHINAHFGLKNVVPSVKRTVDSAGLHRSIDPGSGAFTRHHNLTSIATTYIEAGSELFADYSEGYFVDRGDFIGPVPLSEHFRKGDKIVDQFMSIRKGSMLNSDWWELILSSVDDDRLLQTLPKALQDVQIAANVGTARSGTPGFIRTPEWLEQNALCIDNIRAGQSKVPQAGRGAFAKRFLSKGSVIAPAPVIQFRRDAMDMYYSEDGEHFDGDFIGNQLLLNYCIGHPRSDVLLLPYSPIVNLINHANEPNAKIRWSTSRFQHSEWLNMTQDELVELDTTGLMIDYVALTDISAGEEIFIDYGPIWESAWQQHLLDWVPTNGSKNYTSAVDFSNKHAGDIRTIYEQETNPYPANIITACHFIPPEPDEDESEEIIQLRWMNEEDNFECLLPCHIVSKTIIEDQVFLTAAVGNARSAAVLDHCIVKKRYLVTDIPVSAVKFVDRAYTSDQFIPNAFRHEIGVPEDFFPLSWMDAYQ